MRITLDPSTGAYELLDPDVFTAFSVVVPSPADMPLKAGDVPAALGTSTEDGQHVLVLREAVLALAGAPSRDAAWHDGFAGMLAHAAKAGWVSADGNAIRGHCTAATGTS